jgi:hypothetical protein
VGSLDNYLLISRIDMYQHYEGSLLPYYTRREDLPIVMKY